MDWALSCGFRQQTKVFKAKWESTVLGTATGLFSGKPQMPKKVFVPEIGNEVSVLPWVMI